VTKQAAGLSQLAQLLDGAPLAKRRLVYQDMTTVQSRGLGVCIWGMGVPNADPVGRRGTGRAGGAPKCVPAATEGVHTGPGVDWGGVMAPRPRPYSLTGPVTAQDIMPV